MRRIILDEDKEVGYYLRLSYGQEGYEDFILGNDMVAISFDQAAAEKLVDFVNKVLGEVEKEKKHG